MTGNMSVIFLDLLLSIVGVHIAVDLLVLIHEFNFKSVKSGLYLDELFYCNSLDNIPSGGFGSALSAF